MAKAQQKSEVLVLVGSTNGLVVVPQPTVLTRLHYFDGKLLRADDLSKEQAYLRSLVHLSNQAGGFGLVHGFDLTLSQTGNALLVGPGMAIDPNGRVLLLPVSGTQLGIDELIAKSQASAPQPGLSGDGGGSPPSAASFVSCVPTATAEPTPDHVPQDTSLYLVTVGFAEALCGQDDVFGKLCEEACAGSTDRPFTVEGLVFRAVPLVLGTPLATSTAVALGAVHRRSLVASAYFADEKAALPHLISGAGLRSPTWCKGAVLFCGNDVALGVLSRSGSQTQFLDVWTARRERIEQAPRRYWALRMAMRPWNVFLAQVLQFQCQLAEILKGQKGPGTPDDPCANALNTAASLLADIKEAIGSAGGEAGAAAIQALESFLSQAKTDVTSLPGERLLIEGGIVELPPAGYLPVAPTALATVNEQVRRMVGEGLDLRFCVVRHDFVQHALEEAQHMDRISLLHGLDHPDDRPQVDILVPDGEIVSLAGSKDLHLFRTTVELSSALFDGGGEQSSPPGNKLNNNGEILLDEGAAPSQPSTMLKIEGASRVEPLPGRGAAFHAAGIATAPAGAGKKIVSSDVSSYNPQSYSAASAAQLAGWLTFRVESNPFTSNVGDVVPISGSIVAARKGASAGSVLRANVGGNVRVLAVSHPTAAEWNLSAKLELFFGTETTSGATTEQEADQGTLLVNASFKGAAEGAELTAVVSSPNADDPFSATLKVAWGGTPLTAHVKLSANDDDDAGNPVTVDMIKIKLVHDADILDPNDTWHGIALQAVSMIGVALKDALFADTAEDLLFSSPGLSGGELVVRAVRDWVLFHRRRNKRCSVDFVRPALPARRYQLFVIDPESWGFNNTPTPEEIYQVFVENDLEKIATIREHAQPLTIVEYAGGKATLTTQETTVKSAWQAHVPQGKKITLGLIATKGADDTSILEVARVDRLEQTVSALTPLASDAVSLSVSDVPAEFDTPATDGFILCSIVEDVALECQSTFLMELPDRNAQSFSEILAQNPGIFITLGTSKAMFPTISLGPVHFKPDSALIAGGADVPSGYAQWTGGMPYAVEVAFVDAFTSTDGIVIGDLHRQRAHAIAQTIDANAKLVLTTAPHGGVPALATCPVSAIVAVRQVFADVVAVSTHLSLESARSMLADHDLPTPATTPFHAGYIRFESSNVDKPLSNDISDVLAVFDVAGAGIQPFDLVALTTFAEPGDSIKLSNIVKALDAAGALSPQFDPSEHAFLVEPPNFLAHKEPGARHVLLLVRMVPN